MDAEAKTEARSLLDFWFGPLTPEGLCAQPRNPLWFKQKDSTDEEIGQRFGHLLEAAKNGDLDHWEATDEGLIALIVLMDQFSRNMYRGTPEAFAADSAALQLAQTAIRTGRDQQLCAIHRAFVYMPLEHCEDLEIQEQCTALFEQLATQVDDEQMRSFLQFAQAHYEVIARFGRFPHRNAILGRTSTPEEIEYLETHGGF